jgi:hypothetical protein
MEIEDPRTAWKNQEFEGYLFDKTASEIASDIRRKARAMRWKNIRRDVMEVLVGISCIAAFGLLIEGGQPPLARAGAILMTAGVTCNVIAFLVFRYRYRHRRYDIRWRKILERERRKIIARIRLMRGYTTWQSAPLAAGFVLYTAGCGASLPDWLIEIALIALAGGYFHLSNRRRIQRELLPLLAEIDRELTAMPVTVA